MMRFYTFKVFADTADNNIDRKAGHTLFPLASYCLNA